MGGEAKPGKTEVAGRGAGLAGAAAPFSTGRLHYTFQIRIVCAVPNSTFTFESFPCAVKNCPNCAAGTSIHSKDCRYSTNKPGGYGDLDGDFTEVKDLSLRPELKKLNVKT